MALFRKSVADGFGSNISQQALRPAGAWVRFGTLAGLSLLVLCFSAGHAEAQQEASTATYHVHVLDAARARIAVRATVPSDGAMLSMAESRPGDVPELADAGWPALVQHLRVTDPDGHAVAVASVGPTGWTLARSVSGPLTLEYEVDYAPLAARGWPAPRETAFADVNHLVVLGRSLFIATPVQRRSTVRFELPRGWQSVVPWPMVRGARQSAIVSTTDDLSENLLVFQRGAPDGVAAGGFNIKVVTLGQWEPARAEVRRVLGVALQRLVRLIGFDGHADYLVVLLPQIERGGESFRASFALTLDAAPSRDNRDHWGNTIAHEVFHYWNGWRLHGADYPSSQWFQEGFTEYAANLAMASGGLVPAETFYARLAAHVTNYRELTTALESPGTHKGPPLYSGGALVAFIWDTKIREATHGQRGVGDLLRALLDNTGNGARPYVWSDIQAALESVAPGDWAEFHRRHIHGTEPLPLAEAFTRVGLRMAEGDGGTVRIEPDPAAAESAQALRRAVIYVSS
jgi:predicted metalloprotease with PDZ domain